MESLLQGNLMQHLGKLATRTQINFQVQFTLKEKQSVRVGRFVRPIVLALGESLLLQGVE